MYRWIARRPPNADLRLHCFFPKRQSLRDISFDRKNRTLLVQVAYRFGVTKTRRDEQQQYSHREFKLCDLFFGLSHARSAKKRLRAGKARQPEMLQNESKERLVMLVVAFAAAVFVTPRRTFAALRNIAM